MTDTELWDVCLDGQVMIVALPRKQAEIEAQFFQSGFDRKKASDKRRTGEVTLRRARAHAQQDALYRDSKTHTMVTRP